MILKTGWVTPKECLGYVVEISYVPQSTVWWKILTTQILLKSVISTCLTSFSSCWTQGAYQYYGCHIYISNQDPLFWTSGPQIPLPSGHLNQGLQPYPISNSAQPKHFLTSTQRRALSINPVPIPTEASQREIQHTISKKIQNVLNWTHNILLTKVKVPPNLRPWSHLIMLP